MMGPMNEHGTPLVALLKKEEKDQSDIDLIYYHMIALGPMITKQKKIAEECLVLI